MTTLNDLSIGALKKLQVLGVDETASPEDLELATQKVRSVHAFLKAEGLLRWTLSDIPDYAVEPYLLMAAYLGAPDFQVERDPAGWTTGLRMVQSAVNLPNAGRTRAEYF